MIEKPEYDILIVLGGGVDPQGNLRPFMEEKLDRAAELYKSNLTDFLVMSGGISRSLDEKNYSTSEAAAMKRYLVDNGEAPEHDVLTEGESKNTIGNAYYTRVIHADHMYPGRDPEYAKNILVLTGKTHMPRALETFKWVYGPDYEITPEDVSDDHIDDEKGIEAIIARQEKLLNWQREQLFQKIKPGDLVRIHSFLTNPHGQDPFANEYAEFLAQLDQTNPGFY